MKNNLTFHVHKHKTHVLLLSLEDFEVGRGNSGFFPCTRRPTLDDPIIAIVWEFKQHPRIMKSAREGIAPMKRTTKYPQN